MSYKDKMLEVYAAEIATLRKELLKSRANFNEGIRLAENLDNNTTELLKEFDLMKKKLEEKNIVIKLLMNKNTAYDKYN